MMRRLMLAALVLVMSPSAAMAQTTPAPAAPAAPAAPQGRPAKPPTNPMEIMLQSCKVAQIRTEQEAAVEIGRLRQQIEAMEQALAAATAASKAAEKPADKPAEKAAEPTKKE